MKSSAQVAERLAAFFHRNGYVRWQNEERRSAEGWRIYKKGDEVRLVAGSMRELEVIRRLPRQAGFKVRRPFIKGRQFRQPLYGRPQGRSQPEAARLLGWTPDSVKGRLERGRAKLHRRLLRRGLTLSAMLLALGATHDAALARLPALLSAAILRAVAASMSGMTTGGISTAVLALAEGGLRGLLPVKLKLLSVLVLMVGVVLGGAGAFVYPELAARQQEEKRTAEPNSRTRTSGQPSPVKEKQRIRTDRYGDPLPPGALARLGTIRLRWGISLRSSFFCLPDGKSILSAGIKESQMAVCRWRMATGELLQRWETPLSLTCEAVLSHDGKTLITAGYFRAENRYRVQLWDISSRSVKKELKTGGGQVLALAVSADDKWIATADDQMVRLWNFRTGVEIRRCQGTQDVWSRLVFSPDGKILAAASARRATIQLWDAAAGKELRAVEHGPAGEHALAFSPDSKVLATAANGDKAIRLWDAATGKAVRVLQGDSRISTIAFSPDGKLLASGDGRQEGKAPPLFAIHLWDANTGREVRRLPGHPLYVQALAFSRDGKHLISSGLGSCGLHIWDVASGKDVLPFPEHESYVSSIVFSPDGRLLASGGYDGMVQLWEPASGKPARLFGGDHRQRVRRVGFTSDGRTLSAFGLERSVRFWDVATGGEKRPLSLEGKQDGIGFAYSPDGRTLALGSQDAVIRLVDAATAEEQRRLTAAKNYIVSLHFSPRGDKLAAMLGDALGRNYTVLQLWNAETGKEIRKWAITRVGEIVFSADGRTLFGTEGTFAPDRKDPRLFHAWDIASGEDHPFQAVQPVRVFSMAASPNGRMLAWGDTEGTITLWDLAVGQVRRRLKGHFSSINVLAFSPDGKRLVSGSGDTTALLWDATGAPIDGHAGPLSTERLPSLWDDLANKDAGKAFDAIGLLSASPDLTVPLLKSKLRPAPAAAQRQQVARLIADLDSEEFAVREKAMEQLRQLDERAEPALREALKDKLTLETRKRIDELLEGVRTSAASPQRLRDLRAVEVLEYGGTADARQVLKTLADGAPHARLTREAKASLERLVKRRKPTPK